MGIRVHHPQFGYDERSLKLGKSGNRRLVIAVIAVCVLIVVAYQAFGFHTAAMTVNPHSGPFHGVHSYVIKPYDSIASVQTKFCNSYDLSKLLDKNELLNHIGPNANVYAGEKVFFLKC